MTTSIIVLIISGWLLGWSAGDKDKRYSSGWKPAGFFKWIVLFISGFSFLGAIIGIIGNW